MGQGGGYRNVFLFLPIRRQGATRVRRQPPLGMCGPVGLEYRQLALRRWIGAPDFPSERVGTGLTSLKRKRRGVRKCMSFNALRLRFRLVASDFPGIVCILDGDRSSAVVLGDGPASLEDQGLSAPCTSCFPRPSMDRANPESRIGVEYRDVSLSGPRGRGMIHSSVEEL